ncbi:hypothetical protein ZIOFF_034640 [Zingiber officinale]|uniref:Protein CLP1 homolog n=1 Tax=Zingiber officinale TaxID=94328 RepID=A0A8J5GYF9_ZINOF|nr:hypothetical protein ZIOFF_034640 [Zingiber officinale]
MASSRQFKLAKESELRVEVGPDMPLRIRLFSGTAEIFGTELPPSNWLSISPRSKIAVFTWNGATIELDGVSEVEYVADETPMVSYVNVHAILDARRAQAKASHSNNVDSLQGPRVIVVGPTDSGKSSLCKMLLSWACKQGWKPTYVDLDIGQGYITIPGCIAATPVEMPIDAVEGIPLEMPIVYFYGHTSPTANGDLYKVFVKELARTLERQFSGNAEARAAGMVINTMGWVEGLGYELLLNAIDTFNCDVVLVLGQLNVDITGLIDFQFLLCKSASIHFCLADIVLGTCQRAFAFLIGLLLYCLQEKLCSMLKEVLKTKPKVDVVKLHKSGGIVMRNQKVRQKARSLKIREYFYGPINDLSPHSNIVNFSDISVYRIGGGPQAPRSALPIGAEPVADPTRVVAININRDLLHLVLAVSYAKEPDQIISSYTNYPSSLSDEHVIVLSVDPQQQQDTSLPRLLEGRGGFIKDRMGVMVLADLGVSIYASKLACAIDIFVHCSNVAGYIYVTDIDVVRKKITYLAPCPGELPSKLLIVGTLTWLEG